MYARVTQFQFDPSKRDEATRITDEDIISSMQEEQDFEHIYVLADQATGNGMVITRWSSEAGEQASRAGMGQRFAKLGSIIIAQPSPSQVYEVVPHG